MFDWIKNFLTGNQPAVFLSTETGAEANIPIGKTGIIDNNLGGKVENTVASKMLLLTGKELPADWPRIITLDEERKGYDALYDPGDDRSQPPKNQHIDRLSYTLKNGNKEFRALAVQHIGGPENRNHPQFAAIKANFDEFKPQAVLYEGPVSNPQSITEEQAYTYGDQAFTQYLVLEHNKNLKPGEQPIFMDSWDLQDKDVPEEFRKRGYANEEIAANEVFKWMYGAADRIRNTPGLTDDERRQRLQDLQTQFDSDPTSGINPDFFSLVPRADGQQWTPELIRAEFHKVAGRNIDVNLKHADIPRFQQMFDDARQFRDEYAIRKKAETLRKYDRVLVVEGSGHAIREKPAMTEFVTGEDNTEQQLQSVRTELQGLDIDTQGEKPVDPESVGKEILEMVKKDQDERRKFEEGKGGIDITVDFKNQKRMEQIINQMGWPTISKYGEEICEGAWVLIHHADFNVSLQERALEMMKALPKDEVLQNRIAYLEDRIKVNKKEPQIYGTQNYSFTAEGGVEQPLIENLAELDARRASMGLEPYEEQRRMRQERNKDLTLHSPREK